MKFQLATEAQSSKTGILVLPIFENDPSTGSTSSLQVDSGQKSEIVNDYLKENPKFGKKYETELLYSTSEKILLIGVGKREKFNFEICQNFAGLAVKSLLNKTTEMILFLPDVSFKKVEAAVLGIEIASFNTVEKYKSEKQEIKLENIQIVVEKTQNDYMDELKKAQIVAESINLARTLGDMPSNEMTPAYFLKEARKIALQNKLKLTVINEKKAQKLGMGAFVGVAKGSDEPSYILSLEYLGNIKSKEKLALVGKGLTFDSGGISIKPSSNMHEMKYDMSGAAIVLGVVQAVAKLGLKTNVVGVMAVTENMPSGKALKPGDIVKTYSGKTVEVLNTDAEGRLVLFDALTFAQKDLKSTKIIDLATLTGAMVISLGDFMSGIFGNNPEFILKLIKTGREVGEKFWEMPLDEEYEEMLKSDIADLGNIGRGGSIPGAAGSITAAKFLEQAIEVNKTWIHLDIAGTAWDLSSKAYRSKGATGVGIKTLIELISET
ncbi:MAG: leucyl aminopeptidase [Candidatus Daviesbacteria bacterium]|nr:leucyl aminopeptidase [Candidatus Daviesbacteria bacterium]